MSSFDFDDAPPPAPKARVVVLPNGKSQLIVLGPPRGLWLHWARKRSIPCDGENCPQSRHRLPCHWSGYCPAVFIRQLAELNEGGKRKVLYEPTVLPVNQDQAEQLNYGSFPVVVTVEKKAEQKGYKLCKIEVIKKDDKIPEAFSVEPTLLRIFGRRPPSNGKGKEE